jgi:tetratricopeptide (TPR) repeat protein
LLAVAAVTFALAFDNGSFSLSSRNALGVATWWAVVLAVALGVWPLARIPRLAVAAGVLIAAFAAWTLASTMWASSSELAFLEFDRVALYLGIFLVAVGAGTGRNVATWIDGIAAGIVAVAGVALTSRLFPGSFGDDDLPTLVPSAQERLSFPVQYWNGLGILTALALPLLLRAATVGRTSLVRGLALAPTPILGAVIYLTSSRGAVATVLAGSVIAVAAAQRRWRTAAALAVGVLGGLGSCVALAAQDAVVAGVPSHAADQQGRTAALLIALLCAATGTAWAVLSRVPVRSPRPIVGRVVVAVLALLFVAALLAASTRFDSFKRPPGDVTYAQGDFTRAHLASGNGSGRWQFWSAAADEWRSAPVAGRGAGSFESWWAQHGSIAYFVRDAHSLYAEAAGEVGLVGLALLLAALGCGLVASVARARALDADRRGALAALTGAFAAYLVGAGIDWMWELTVVSVVGIACLGLLVGPATQPLGLARSELRPRFALGAAIVALGWLLICAEGVPLLADQRISSSESAARGGHMAAAIDDALTARKLEPWAATPYLQLALLSERAGDLHAARAWIAGATARDPENWRPWLVTARIETKSGRIPAARRALRRATALNPRSPLFSAASTR